MILDQPFLAKTQQNKKTHNVQHSLKLVVETSVRANTSSQATGIPAYFFSEALEFFG